VAIDNRPIRLKHYLHRRDLLARPTNVCSLGNDVTQSRDARLSPVIFRRRYSRSRVPLVLSL
jgi:hypothetical protein